MRVYYDAKMAKGYEYIYEKDMNTCKKGYEYMKKGYEYIYEYI